MFANSVDPAQTPCSAVSDLSLHCLHMSHLWNKVNRKVQGVPKSQSAARYEIKFILMTKN